MRKTGFTIVELLIVIVVITILAAITIVTYKGVQNRVNDTMVQNDLNNFAKKMELYKADNGTYPHDSDDFSSSLGISFSRSAYGLDSQSHNLRYCHNPSTDEYIIIALSRSGNYFQYKTGNGLALTSVAYGWTVCSRVGLSETNPSPNALSHTTWASWVN